MKLHSNYTYKAKEASGRWQQNLEPNCYMLNCYRVCLGKKENTHFA